MRLSVMYCNGTGSNSQSYTYVIRLYDMNKAEENCIYDIV